VGGGGGTVCTSYPRRGWWLGLFRGKSLIPGREVIVDRRDTGHIFTSLCRRAGGGDWWGSVGEGREIYLLPAKVGGELLSIGGGAGGYIYFKSKD